MISLEELNLILNILIYVDNLLFEGNSIYDAIIDYEQKGFLGFNYPGELTKNEFISIVSVVKNNEILFKNLQIVDVTTGDQNERMATIVSGEDVFFIFQGTASKEEWRDNEQGSHLEVTDTPQQLKTVIYYDGQIARLKKENYPISNIYLSGHSKGGNKAQYLTIMRGQEIRQTITFNAQGFNYAFISKYKEAISSYESKITAINNEADFVSVLLFPIASNIKYLKSTTTYGDALKPERMLMHKLLGTHALYALYTINQKGQFILNEPTTQVSSLKSMGDLGRYLAAYMTNADWKYTTHISMAFFKQEKVSNLSMPKGYQQRLLYLINGYLQKSQEELTFDVCFLLQCAFTNKINVDIKPVLSIFPNANFTMEIRDFSLETKKVLLELTTNNTKKLPLLNTLDNRFVSHLDIDDNYHFINHHMDSLMNIDLKTQAQIKTIFDQVQACEATYNLQLEQIIVQAQEVLGQIKSTIASISL